MRCCSSRLIRSFSLLKVQRCLLTLLCHIPLQDGNTLILHLCRAFSSSSARLVGFCFYPVVPRSTNPLILDFFTQPAYSSPAASLPSSKISILLFLAAFIAAVLPFIMFSIKAWHRITIGIQPEPYAAPILENPPLNPRTSDFRRGLLPLVHLFSSASPRLCSRGFGLSLAAKAFWI